MTHWVLSGGFAPAAKSRQVTFKETGGVAYGKAQAVAYTLRSAGYAAEQGSIPSPAGSYADTVYVMTNAPMPQVRRAAKHENLTVK